MVHWDLHPGNLLAGPDGLSAIVDTDFAAVGDGAFDLVMLATASLALPCEPGVRTRLSRAAFEGLGDTKRRAYLAHLFVRFLDWAIRRGCSRRGSVLARPVRRDARPVNGEPPGTGAGPLPWPDDRRATRGTGPWTKHERASWWTTSAGSSRRRRPTSAPS